MDFIKFIVTLIVGVSLFFGFIVGIGFWLSYATCQSQLKVSGMSGTWGPLIECQVQLVDGSYIPLSRWRGFEQVERKK